MFQCLQQTLNLLLLNPLKFYEAFSFHFSNPYFKFPFDKNLPVQDIHVEIFLFWKKLKQYFETAKSLLKVIRKAIIIELTWILHNLNFGINFQWYLERTNLRVILLLIESDS